MPAEALQQAIERVQQLYSPTYKDRMTHVYAVVTECTLPRRTRGTDFVVNLQLTDESQEDENGNYEQVELIVFSRTVDDMPRARLGDIIELRSVMVQFWEPPTGGRRAQLFGKMSKPHAFGFLLYHQAAPLSQDPTAAVQPYQVYNAQSLGGQHTAERLTQLRALAGRLGAKPVQDVAQTYLRRIRDLDLPRERGDRPEVVDLKVQVLAVDRRKQSEEVVLYVWDGTDAKPQPADIQMPPSIWKGVELKVTHTQHRTMPLQQQPPQLQVLAELPPIGTALPVVMDAAAVPPAGLPEVGQWIKIRVAGLLVVKGQMQVVFTSCSNLSVLQAPPNGWQDRYQARLANNDTSEWPQEEATLVATCSRSDLQHRSTIRQVLLKAAQGEVGPFRVQLRLVGFCPRDLKEWCVPVKKRAAAAAAAAAAATSSTGDHQQQQWEWAAHLLLEDATGTLRALLVSRAAERLLGLPPTDLGSNSQDVAQLQQIVEYLSTVDGSGGAWMDVALTAVPVPAAAAPALLQPPPQQQEQQQQQQEETGQQQGLLQSSQQYRLILHDAVCHHVQQQEEKMQRQQQQQQQCSLQQASQIEGRDADIIPCPKRQCLGLEQQEEQQHQQCHVQQHCQVV